jgi:hypothetical protein
MRSTKACIFDGLAAIFSYYQLNISSGWAAVLNAAARRKKKDHTQKKPNSVERI